MNQSPCQPYLPPEWAEQSAIMLTWPHDKSDWGDDLESVERVFLELASAIVEHETCLIVCRDRPHQSSIENQLASLPNEKLIFAIAESNDIWARDHGPLTVICQNEPTLLNFRFNGWGGKFNSDLDNAITPTVFKQGIFDDTPLEDVDLILEGGAIEVDGSGTLMATRRSVITNSRNPEMNQTSIENRLSESFGIHRFIWLDHGALEGDDTDGHVDTLARFADRNTIMYCTCDEPSDPHYTELLKLKQELEQTKTVTGESYRLIPLPLPKAITNNDDKRLPATYANFLLLNAAVLVPTYNDKQDADVLELFRSVFTDRDIVPINCTALVQQFGSLHCATMQLPAGVALKQLSS